MTDINMLKAITEETAARAEPGGRWDHAEEAVNGVLHVLYENAQASAVWKEVYDAIKRAYVGSPSWSDDSEPHDLSTGEKP